MKVLVVGAGGREHALVKKIKESPKVSEVFCTPGNGGISRDATCFSVGATDIAGVVALAQEISADLVVVAPDDPLVLGMVDALNKVGIKTFGPNAAAAIIEGSKVFSKNLMKKYNIPTADYDVFDDPTKALNFIKEKGSYPTVIKADGLALGKGVIIAESFEEAEAGVNSIMNDKIFGNSGNHVVVEEFITGPEVSVLAFTDGKCVKPMVSSMDHKRALDGDKGKNTGGMGAITPNPFYTKAIEELCMKTIFLPSVEAMNKEGRTFKGCLYFGLMLTQHGPKLIEYNCRFGDPETQVVLPMLKTDIIDIFKAINEESLADLDIQWENGACSCVVMASPGYPGNYPKGIEISGLDQNGQIGSAIVYHAGTADKDGKLVTAGGRVLGVTAKGKDIEEALCKAYSAVEKIKFDGAHYRKDIGSKSLEI